MSKQFNSEDFEKLVREVTDLKQSLANAVKPPEYVIMDDVDLRTFLKVCKRTTATWREKGMITFSKLGGKIYYRLSDILAFLKKHETLSIDSNLKLGL